MKREIGNIDIARSCTALIHFAYFLRLCSALMYCAFSLRLLSALMVCAHLLRFFTSLTFCTYGLRSFTALFHFAYFLRLSFALIFCDIFLQREAIEELKSRNRKIGLDSKLTTRLSNCLPVCSFVYSISRPYARSFVRPCRCTIPPPPSTFAIPIPMLGHFSYPS